MHKETLLIYSKDKKTLNSNFTNYFNNMFNNSNFKLKLLNDKQIQILIDEEIMILSITRKHVISKYLNDSKYKRDSCQLEFILSDDTTVNNIRFEIILKEFLSNKKIEPISDDLIDEVSFIEKSFEK